MLEGIPKWLMVSAAQKDKDTASLTWLKLSPSSPKKKAKYISQLYMVVRTAASLRITEIWFCGVDGFVCF